MLPRRRRGRADAAERAMALRQVQSMLHLTHPCRRTLLLEVWSRLNPDDAGSGQPCDGVFPLRCSLLPPFDWRIVHGVLLWYPSRTVVRNEVQ